MILGGVSHMLSFTALSKGWAVAKSSMARTALRGVMNLSKSKAIPKLLNNLSKGTADIRKLSIIADKRSARLTNYKSGILKKFAKRAPQFADRINRYVGKGSPKVKKGLERTYNAVNDVLSSRPVRKLSDIALRKHASLRAHMDTMRFKYGNTPTVANVKDYIKTSPHILHKQKEAISNIRSRMRSSAIAKFERRLSGKSRLYKFLKAEVKDQIYFMGNNLPAEYALYKWDQSKRPEEHRQGFISYSVRNFPMFIAWGGGQSLITGRAYPYSGTYRTKGLVRRLNQGMLGGFKFAKHKAIADFPGMDKVSRGFRPEIQKALEKSFSFASKYGPDGSFTMPIGKALDSLRDTDLMRPGKPMRYSMFNLPRNIGKAYKTAKRVFKQERKKIKLSRIRGENAIYGMEPDHVRFQRDNIRLAETLAKEHGMSPSGVKNIIQTVAEKDYQRKAQRHSKLMNWINNQVYKDSPVPAMKLSKTDVKIGKDTYQVAKGRGFYKLKGKEYDLRRWSPSNMFVNFANIAARAIPIPLLRRPAVELLNARVFASHARNQTMFSFQKSGRIGTLTDITGKTDKSIVNELFGTPTGYRDTLEYLSTLHKDDIAIKQSMAKLASLAKGKTYQLHKGESFLMSGGSAFVLRQGKAYQLGFSKYAYEQGINQQNFQMPIDMKIANKLRKYMGVNDNPKAIRRELKKTIGKDTSDELIDDTIIKIRNAYKGSFRSYTDFSYGKKGGVAETALYEMLGSSHIRYGNDEKVLSPGGIIRRKTVEEINEERRLLGRPSMSALRRIIHRFKSRFELGEDIEPSLLKKLGAAFATPMDPTHPLNMLGDSVGHMSNVRQMLYKLTDPKDKQKVMLRYKNILDNMEEKGILLLKKSNNFKRAAQESFEELGIKYDLDSFQLKHTDNLDEIMTKTDSMRKLVQEKVKRNRIKMNELGPDMTEETLKMMKMQENLLKNTLSNVTDIEVRARNAQIFNSNTGYRNVTGELRVKGINENISAADVYNAKVLRMLANIDSEKTSTEYLDSIAGKLRRANQLSKKDELILESSKFVDRHVAEVYYSSNRQMLKNPDFVNGFEIENTIDSFLSDYHKLNKGTKQYIEKMYYRKAPFGARLPRVTDYNPDVKVEDSMGRLRIIVPESGFSDPNRSSSLFSRWAEEEIRIRGGDYDNPAIRSMVKTTTGDITLGTMNAASIFRTIQNTANYIGIGFNPSKTPTPMEFMKKIMTKRVVPMAIGVSAFGVLDGIIGRLPMFDDTILTSGVSGLLSEGFQTTRLISQRAMEITGIAAGARYIEDLMPGFINSPASGLLRGIGPIAMGLGLGMRYGRVNNAGVRPAAMKAGLAGLGVGLFLGGGPAGMYGEWDITEHPSELHDKFEGKKLVPVRRGRFWELNSTSFWGSSINYYRPHMTALIDSDWESSNALYGGQFNKIRALINPGRLAKMHYYSRPYPESPGLFSGMPLFGDALSIGSRQMHREEIKQLYAGGGLTAVDRTGTRLSGNSTGEYGIGSAGMKLAQNGTYLNNTSDLPYRFAESMKGMGDLIGLKGFMLENTIGEDIIGSLKAYPTAERASKIGSLSRRFYDLEMGGLMGCFVGETMVNTYNGYKPIMDVEIGEQVLSDGKYRKVINKVQYSNKKVRRIDIKSFSESLYVTDMHKIPVYRRDSSKIEVSDISAKDINIGDYLQVPVISCSVDIFHESLEEQSHHVIEELRIDNDLLYIMGWWIARGSIKEFAQLNYELSIDEIDIAHKIGNIITSKFGNTYMIDKVSDDVIVLGVQCVPLSILFPSLFGREEHKKHIPNRYKTLPLERLKHLLIGIIDGSGWRNSNNSEFTSKSERLTRDVYDIALRYKICGQLELNRTQKGIRNHIHWGKKATEILNSLLNDEVILNDVFVKYPEAFYYNGNMYVCVAKNSDTDRVETVYDLTIEDKHYYVAEFVKVHNTNEMIRRFVIREDKEREYWNPLRNIFPDWLPSDKTYFKDFLHGDAFSEIEMGETRLPSDAYDRLYPTRYTMPIDTDVFAFDKPDELVAYYTGDPEFLSNMYQQEERISAVKDTVMEQLKVPGYKEGVKTMKYDHVRNISGAVDMVSKMGNAQVPIKIAPANSLNYEKEMNAYLNIANMNSGLVIYVDPETGMTQQVQVNRNPEEFADDLNNIAYARRAAADVIYEKKKKGIPFTPANSYSRLDRMRILADVAPYSSEYRASQQIMEQRVTLGLASPFEKVQYENIVERQKNVVDKMDYQRRRFWNVGTPATEAEIERQRRIKEEYNVLERVIGAGWERLRSFDTALHSKLLHNEEAIHEYGMNEVYGRGFKSWSAPINDFLRPYTQTFIRRTDPLQGALSLGTFAYLFGGGPLGMVGAVAGGAYATANKGVAAITGSEGGLFPIAPKYRREQREIDDYVDALEYQKNMIMYETSGDQSYKWKANATITGKLIQDEPITEKDILMAANKPERKYVKAFLEAETVEEREKILKLVPRSLGELLRNYWEGTNIQMSPDDMLHGMILPSDDWIGYSNDVSLKDVHVHMLKQEGLNAHDSGLGYYSQENRMIRQAEYLSENINLGRDKQYLARKPVKSEHIMQLKAALSYLTGDGNVRIVEDTSDTITVNITIV